MSKKLTFAQIGMGLWGPNLFRNFFEHEAVSFKLVADIDPQKLKKVSHYGVETTQKSDEVFRSDNGIDVVVVSTPVATHFELTKKALLAGKHVFLEKPPAHTYLDTSRIVKSAKKANVILMIGYIYRFETRLKMLKSLLDNSQFGKLLYMSFKFNISKSLFEKTNFHF